MFISSKDLGKSMKIIYNEAAAIMTIVRPNCCGMFMCFGSCWRFGSGTQNRPIINTPSNIILRGLSQLKESKKERLKERNTLGRKSKHESLLSARRQHAIRP